MKKILKFQNSGSFPSLSGEFQTGANYNFSVPPVSLDMFNPPQSTLLQEYKTKSGAFANSSSSPAASNLGNQAASQIGSSVIGKFTDFAAKGIFGDGGDDFTRGMSQVFSSGLNSVGNTVLNNAIKKQVLTNGLGKNALGSLKGVGIGLGSSLVGKGITSAMGNSKLGKFTGTAGSSVPSQVLSGGGSPANIAMSAVGAGLSAAFGPSKEYQGRYGSITRNMDSAYDLIQGTVGSAIPVVGAAMALNKGLSNIFGSTSGMCVCAGTKVFTSTGEIVNIEDLVQEQGIIGWSEKTHEIRPQTIKGFIEPRQKECVEILLATGKYLKCSFDHPIYSKLNDTWKFIPAAELKSRDIVGTVSLKDPNTIFIDFVLRVKPIGIQTVYNLETVEDHTYIANGIITHNTKQDAILGSAFMPAPIKWLNMAGAKTTDTFKNQSWQNTEKTNAFMQNAFGNLGDRFDKARAEAGKTYGTFSRHKYKEARDNVNFANTAWDQILDMTRQNEYQNIRAQEMSSINNQRYAQMIQGGFSPLARGKMGMKILNNSINHNLGQRFLSGAALIDNKQVILSKCREVD